MILVPANKVEKIKYFSTLLGRIFIEITRCPLHIEGALVYSICNCAHSSIKLVDF